MSIHMGAVTNDLLTTTDAARILGLSPDMVRVLARDGRLPAAAESVRGLRMFRREDVEALASERAGQHTHQHIVQFYEDSTFLDTVVAGFVAEGLRSRGPVLVIATGKRREAVLGHLASNAHDVDLVLSSGSLTLLDARETLDEFVVDGRPDRKRFRTHIGRLIAESRKARKRLRVYGEMVDLLCRDGRLEAALRFEELWNEIARDCRLSRLCAYAMDHFKSGDDVSSFERVCALHTHVVPTERYVDSKDPQERLRRVAILEQQAHALRTEMAFRRRLDANRTNRGSQLAASPCLRGASR